jgi:hypothetical protein
MKLSKIKALFATTVLGVGMVATTALAADVTYVAQPDEFPIPASTSYTVAADATEVEVTVAYTTNVEYNDWCGNALKVTDTDGTVTYYGFGGAQVSWNASLEEDGDEVVPAAGSDAFFTLDGGNGTFTIPVAGAGTVIDVYDLCWDSVPDATHYTIDFVEAGISEDAADDTAAADDATEADDTAAADDATEAEATEAPTTTEAPTDTATATGDTAPIAMVVVLMAAAASAIVVMKKREA